MNRLGRHKCAPLHLASENGHVKVMELLLNAGASVNIRVGKASSTRYRQTPLHFACQKPKAIQILLAHRAFVDPRDRHKSTPLILAARKGNGEVVKYLLDAGASTSTASDSGETALHAAAKCGS